MARRRKTIAVEEVIQDLTVAPITSFEEAVVRFLESLRSRGLRPMTLRWHKANLNDVAQTLSGRGIDTDPTKITKDQLQRQYITYSLDVRRLTPTTINGRIVSLKQFYRWLYEEGHVPKNATDGMQKVRVDEKEPPSLTREQVRRILGTPKTTTFVGLRDHTMMMLLVETGIRLKELMNLRLTDVNLLDQYLAIHETKNRRDRIVPFQREMANALKRWIKVRGVVLGEDRLFVSIDEEPLTRKGIQDRIKLYGLHAGINNVRVSPHTFRHTSARLYIENGGDPFSLQRILGHSSQDMVSHYVRFWGKDLHVQHRKYSPLANLGRVDTV